VAIEARVPSVQDVGRMLPRHGDQSCLRNLGSCRIRRANSRPPIVGIARSQKTTSGRQRSSCSRPWSPSVAICYPAPIATRRSRRTPRTSSSSSMNGAPAKQRGTHRVIWPGKLLPSIRVGSRSIQAGLLGSVQMRWTKISLRCGGVPESRLPGGSARVVHPTRSTASRRQCDSGTAPLAEGASPVL
jgi:hypothetical protein